MLDVHCARDGCKHSNRETKKAKRVLGVVAIEKATRALQIFSTHVAAVFFSCLYFVFKLTVQQTLLFCARVGLCFSFLASGEEEKNH